MSRDEHRRSGDGEPRTPGWLAEALDAEAERHVPDTRRMRAVMREHAEGGARGRGKQSRLARLPLLPRRLSGVPAGIAAGALCAALVVVVSTTYEGARSHPSSPSSQSTEDGAHFVTAAGTVDAGSRAGWSQEDVAVTFTQPITGFQLSVKVSLDSTGSSAGYSSTFDAALFNVTVDTQARALVYKFNLKPGKTLPAGPSRFAVQFDYAAVHKSADDTYYVSVYTDTAQGRVADVAQGTF